MARSAVARCYQKTYGITYSPEQVIISSGAKHALHTALVSRILRDQSYAEEITLSEEAVADWPAEHLAVAD